MARKPSPIRRDKTALIVVDMQNDFIHPEGAYARGGAKSELIAALPERLVPLLDACRDKGIMTVATQFTLVPGRGGKAMIADHLLELRPFLRDGDFAPGSWGQQVLDELGPIDAKVEKIAFSAFYQSRLEYLLRRCGIEHALFTGIVTNGGVASTAREAHVRDMHVSVISDGCAAFTQKTHDATVADLSNVVAVQTIQDVMTELAAL